MTVRPAAFAVALVLLAGCAASVKRHPSDGQMAAIPSTAASRLVLNVTGTPAATGAGDWAGFRQEWRESFEEQSRLAGIAFEMQDGPPKPTGDAGPARATLSVSSRAMPTSSRH